MLVSRESEQQYTNFIGCPGCFDGNKKPSIRPYDERSSKASECITFENLENPHCILLRGVIDNSAGAPSHRRRLLQRLTVREPVRWDDEKECPWLMRLTKFSWDRVNHLEFLFVPCEDHGADGVAWRVVLGRGHGFTMHGKSLCGAEMAACCVRRRYGEHEAALLDIGGGEPNGKLTSRMVYADGAKLQDDDKGGCIVERNIYLMQFQIALDWGRILA